ncbi:hypothetical protein JM18_007635 [Phytophthora kernoviae]|uniref:Uncharacterized protein n=1 Tax=Phytophthora kernoviae TaxID=325452 RepID=A0A8T0LR31_9STRA|nr:hypothetical protein JM16_007842 [Phytophthora kernoviae]KAG2518210.1 hypothetical protein JM18_007635 [Phytophthora kernoviae]
MVPGSAFRRAVVTSSYRPLDQEWNQCHKWNISPASPSLMERGLDAFFAKDFATAVQLFTALLETEKPPLEANIKVYWYRMVAHLRLRNKDQFRADADKVGQMGTCPKYFLEETAEVERVCCIPPMQLHKAVGIVTGAASGVGRGFAEFVLRGGGSVLLTDLNEKLLETTTDELKATYGKTRVGAVVQNVTEPDSFGTTFDAAPKLFDREANLLVNNAGISTDPKLFEDDSSLYWQKVIEVNLMGVMRGTQVGIDRMKTLPDGGVIVNIASVFGLGGTRIAADYTAAKHGVVGFTRALASMKEEHNVRIVCMAPGFIDTPLARSAGMTDDHPVVAPFGGLLSVDAFYNGFVETVENEKNSGQVLHVLPSGHAYFDFPSNAKLATARPL